MESSPWASKCTQPCVFSFCPEEGTVVQIQPHTAFIATVAFSAEWMMMLKGVKCCEDRLILLLFIVKCLFLRFICKLWPCFDCIRWPTKLHNKYWLRSRFDFFPFPPHALSASRSPGSYCVGYRSSRRQYLHSPAARVLWPRPSWPGLLPGLHPGGALSWRGDRRGGVPIWCYRSVRGGGASGWPGNICLLLQPRAEGVSPW